MVATTSTKAPGRSVSPSPLASARKRTVRLAPSTLASSATISAVAQPPGICGAASVTVAPGRIAAAAVLRQREIDIGIVVDALQHRDGAADIEIGAGLQIGQADAGAERRPDRFLLDADLKVQHAGVGGRELLLRFVQLLRRDGLRLARSFLRRS